MNSIPFQLEKMNQKIKELSSIYHHFANKFGISDSEFWVWYALLVLNGEFTQQDICDIWSYPKQTVNTVISNMSKKGYIYLDVIPKTRNRKVIRLTTIGKEYGEKILSHIQTAEKNTYAKFSAQERENCIYLLDKYISILKEELTKHES